jgi:type IV fimbrial biogenesis protein FimT
VRGFTFFELLVTLAIAALVLHWTTTSFSEIVAGQRASLRINGLIAAVNVARHTAITRRTRTTLCPGRDRCGERDSWHRGALIFTDHNGNRQIDPGDAIAARLPAMNEGERVYWRAFRNRSYLQFEPTGLTDWQNGNFQYCPADLDPRFSRQIIINAQGRVRHARDRNGDGIAEDASGKPLTCSE